MDSSAGPSTHTQDPPQYDSLGINDQHNNTPENAEPFPLGMNLVDRINNLETQLRHDDLFEIVLGNETDPAEGRSFSGTSNDRTISEQALNFKKRKQSALKLMQKSFENCGLDELKSLLQNDTDPASAWKNIHMAYLESFRDTNNKRIAFAGRAPPPRLDEIVPTQSFFDGFQHIQIDLGLSIADFNSTKAFMALMGMGALRRLLLSTTIKYVHPDAWSVEQLKMHWRLWHSLIDAIFGPDIVHYKAVDNKLIRKFTRLNAQSGSSAIAISVDQTTLHREMRRLLKHGYTNWAPTVHLYSSKKCPKLCKHKADRTLHEGNLQMMPIGEVVSFFKQDLTKINIRRLEPVIASHVLRRNNRGREKGRPSEIDLT